MAAPTPLQSFLGGVTLPIPVHALMLLNGNVLGVSGFIHRAIRGGTEAITSVAGLVLGGIAAGLIEGVGPEAAGLSLPKLVASGFLVGLGTKLANGCTSGHMVCGVARFSMRSIVATAIFCTTGVVTAQLAHGGLGPAAPLDWSFGVVARNLLIAQVVPLAISITLYFFTPSQKSQSSAAKTPDAQTPLKERTEHAPQVLLRHLASLTTTVQFALALQLSGLTSPPRVVRFLLLPFHRGFDPSLCFLAAGTTPLTALLYHYARGSEVPKLGGQWRIPKGGEIEWKLITGAAIFGVGWGMAGICPGPGLVNLGRALVHDDGQLLPVATWLAAVGLGGFLA